MSSVEQQRYSEEIDIRRGAGAGSQVSRIYRCELAVGAGRRYKNAVHMRPAMTPIHYWRSITYLPDETAEPRPTAVRKHYVSGVNCEPRLRVNRRSETAFVFQKALAASATSTLTCQSSNAAMWFKSGVDRPCRERPVFQLHTDVTVRLPELSDDGQKGAGDVPSYSSESICCSSGDSSCGPAFDVNGSHPSGNGGLADSVSSDDSYGESGSL